MEAIRLCAEEAISVEAWRYYNVGWEGRDGSAVIAESIFASGGKVQDVPVESPGRSTGWTAEEREVIAEAARRGVRGYIQVRGTREADPETQAEWRRERVRLASVIVDGLRAKKLEGTLSDREQQTRDRRGLVTDIRGLADQGRPYCSVGRSAATMHPGGTERKILRSAPFRWSLAPGVRSRWLP